MRILGIAGSKRAGKDSAARLIMGHVLQQNDVIDKFEINDNGELLVNSAYRDGESGKMVEAMGVFDVTRIDPAFQFYMAEKVWPHIKFYNFADGLKWVCFNLFGLTYEQLHGTTEEKESATEYKCEQIIQLLPKALKPKVEKDACLTAREFQQTMGDIMRWIDDGCFVKSCIQRILTDQCPFAIITDVRRPEEVEAIKAVGGKVIFLTRKEHNDTHRIENGFDGVDKSIFDAVIDNRSCSIQDKNTELYKEVHDWGWI